MGIIRGGDSEYEEKVLSLEEKAPLVEQQIKSGLQDGGSKLQLSGKYYGTDEITLISQSPLIVPVRSLDLSDNQIGDEALKILFESESLENLECLILNINFITDKGILDIANSGSVVLKKLKSLFLSDNKLTDASVSELVRSRNFDSLECLDVGWNEIGNGTAKALGETDALPCLKILELERGYIDSDGIKDFLAGRLAGQLEELNLSANKLNDAAVTALATAPALASLKVLRLSQNQIGDEGVRAIGESTSLAGLTHLYLGRNYFTPDGGKAVYETKTLTNLKTLVLQEGVETTPGLVNYSKPELLRPDHE